MVAKHVHVWIILQCSMFCPSQLLTAVPSRMLHGQITMQLQLHWWILTNCQWLTAGCIEHKKVDSTARRKLMGLETSIVIRTILKLNSWDFLMTSTILLLNFSTELLATIHLELLFCHWWSKDRKNGFVINKICKLISIKSLIFGFRHRNLMLSWCHAEVSQTYPTCALFNLSLG